MEMMPDESVEGQSPMHGSADCFPAEEEWETQRNHSKLLGDQSYRAGDFDSAIQHYTLALSFDPENPTLLSNRSAAYLQRNEKSKALADAKRCVELNRAFVKGYIRWAAAAQSLKRWAEARSIYDKLVETLPHEKDNAALLRGLEECKAGEKLEKDREKELLAQLLNQQVHPEVQKAMSDKSESTHHVEEEEEQDILDDFFSEVEQDDKKTRRTVTDAVATTSQPITLEKHHHVDTYTDNTPMQSQLSDLGTVEYQITRLLCPNHPWLNLNPFRVLDITDPNTPMDVISRRYKALSLLLHPDKVQISPDSSNLDQIKNQALMAFDYVKEAMNTLKDEDKLRHVRALIEQGMKNAKREYDKSLDSSKPPPSSEKYQKCLLEIQNKTVAKMFAQIEQERREAERRKTSNEQREREQEDREAKKIKKDMEFDKSWREENRMEKRMGNWRDFSRGGGGGGGNPM